MAGRVIVLGGGVAGMTAAHELSERGFDVTVLETRDAVGGKARSFPFSGSGSDGRPPLPGEHGFRFFPGFYRHLPHTMRRIPYGSRTVAHNLVTARNVQIASREGEELLAPAHLPRDFRDLHQGFRFSSITPTACESPRRTWPTSSTGCCCSSRAARSAASPSSRNYAKYLADGLTRTLVAARAREMSARTGGYILLQLLFDMANPTGQVDRVLNGPTSDVWIDPWHAHLRDRYYLDRDLRGVHGHTIYIDSPWALTSISQPQFWEQFQPDRLGDGRARGILSVDVSDWEAIGSGIRKQAMFCSREEITAEVWHQLEESLDDDATRDLEEVTVLASFLDPSIVHPNPTEATNLEPLLINTAGSWSDRPEAASARLENLFLASDYVRTHTDLATMEGANEAARRAVNAILERSSSSAEPCPVWKLREPPLFAPFRALDKVLFKLGRPARPRIRFREGRVEAARPLAWSGRLAERVLGRGGR